MHYFILLLTLSEVGDFRSSYSSLCIILSANNLSTSSWIESQYRPKSLFLNFLHTLPLLFIQDKVVFYFFLFEINYNGVLQLLSFCRYDIVIF